MKAETHRDYRERIQQVLVHIQQHLDEAVGLDELAAVACFSPYHFHRIFRGMVGESVKSHVRRLRLERAAHRLKFTDQPVTRLAFEAGYETHESFTRAFKAMFEQPPKAFRAQHRAVAYPAVPCGVHYDPDGPPSFSPLSYEGPPIAVRVEHLAPLYVLAKSHIGPYDQVGSAWSALFAWAGSRGLVGMIPTSIGVVHDDPAVTPPDRLRYDACLAVSEDVQGEGDLQVRKIGGGDYAVAHHRGPYDQLGQTYARLCGEWLPGSGREPRWASALEFYRNSPLTTSPPDLWTSVYLALEPLGGPSLG